MKKQNQNTNHSHVFRITSVAAIVVMILAISAAAFGAFFDSNIDVDALGANDEVYVAFTSDAHVTADASTTDTSTTLGRTGYWLDGVATALGIDEFDTFATCGDNGSAYSSSETIYWNAVQQFYDVIDDNDHVNNIVLTTGNHDVESPGYYVQGTTYTNIESKVTSIGEPTSFYTNTNGYKIYCFGAKANYYQNFDDDDIADLDTFLSGCSSDEPVFVLAHYPLVNYSSRTISNTSAVISVLNKYPNVIYLWGHNHTEADTHYDNVYSGSLDGTAINFTYCAAGCMSDSEYSTGSASVQGKGLVAEIDGSDIVTLTYYSKNCTEVCSYNVDITTGTATKNRNSSIGENEDMNHDYIETSTLVDGGQYIISSDGYGLLNQIHTGFVNSNNYTYSGLAGGELDVDSGSVIGGMQNDMVWTAHASGSGWTFTDVNGKYLVSTYGSTTRSISISTTPEVWTWSSSTNKLTSSSATNSMCLSWQSESDAGTGYTGTANLFTTRSSSNTHTVTFYKVTDFDEEEDSEAEEGDFQLVSSLVDGGEYIISAEGYGMTDDTNSGYTYTSNSYTYSGFDGVELSVTNNIIDKSFVESNSTLEIWTAHASGSGWTFTNGEGKYLMSYYSSGGKIYLGDTAEVWTWSTTLVSSNTSKYLTWEAEGDMSGITGNEDLFSIRSSSSADAISFYQRVGETVSGDYTLASSLVDGEKYIISAEGYGMTDDANTGYVVTSNSYNYQGFDGVELTINGNSIASSFVAENPTITVWTAHASGDGWSFTNESGKYLTSYYAKTGDYIGGKIELGTTEETWIWDGTLKSDSSSKYLTWEAEGDMSGITGDEDLFSIRSTGDTISFYHLCTKTAEYGDYENTTTLVDGKKYIISAEGIGLTNNPQAEGGFTDKNSYVYSGLDGVELTIEDGIIDGDSVEDQTDLITWTAHATDSGWTFTDESGQYLNSAYSTTTPKGGSLSVGTTAEEWTWDGSGKLYSTSSTKYLNWQTESDAGSNYTGTALFFTVRSYKDSVSFYQLKEEPAFTEASSLTNGCWYILAVDSKAMTIDANSGYTNSSNYSYSGFDGVDITVEDDAVTSAVNRNMLWKAVRVSGGYYLQDLEGLYLSAHYGTNGNGGYSCLSTTPVLWHYDDGKLYATVENSKKVYITWETATDAGTVTSGSAELFSIRSSGDTITLYKAGENTWTPDDDFYIKGDLVDDNTAVLAFDGNSINNSLKTDALTIAADGNTLLNKVDSDSVWTVDKVSNGYTFKNGSSYLGISDNEAAMVSSAYTWKVQNNGLYSQSASKYLTVSDGTLGLSSSADTITFFVKEIPTVITYAAGEGGTVSSTTEKAYYQVDLKGSTATADKGYDFTAWTNASGQSVSTTAEFVPSSQTAATYTATFTEQADVTITYVAGEHGSVSVATESVAPVTGTPSGSTATADDAYYFVDWQDASGNTVSTEATFVPEKTDGLYAEATYTATFAKIPVCVGEKEFELSEDGTYTLEFNGNEAGEYTLTKVADVWTIQNPSTNQYLAAVNGKYQFQDDLFHWAYDGGFYYQTRSYTTTTTLGISTTTMTVSDPMYLAYADGSFVITSAETDVAVIDEFSYLDHTWNKGKTTTKPTCESKGVKTYTCKDCGATYTEEIPALSDGHQFSDEWTVDREADCETAGSKSHHCINCDEKTDITVIPALGHNWDEGVVTKAATMTETGILTYTCTRCGKTKTEVIPKLSKSFVDVTSDKYYYDAVNWALGNGITSGTSETTFSPDATCTRGQVVTFLWRAAGSPEIVATNPFTDVDSGAYYYEAVMWAVKNEITSGMTEYTFGPEEPCTRGQVVTFMFRAAEDQTITTKTNPFVDVSTSDYFYKSVLWAVERDITKGMDSTHFAPSSQCTRGQIVTFLYRGYNED